MDQAQAHWARLSPPRFQGASLSPWPLGKAAVQGYVGNGVTQGQWVTANVMGLEGEAAVSLSQRRLF